MTILETRNQILTLLCLAVIFGLLLIEEKNLLVRTKDQIIQIKSDRPTSSYISQEQLKSNLLRAPYCGTAKGLFYVLKFLRNGKLHLWAFNKIHQTPLANKPHVITNYLIKNNQLRWEHKLLGASQVFEFSAQTITNPENHFLVLRGQDSLLSPLTCRIAASL